MTNYFLAVNLPRSKHDQWVQDLIKATSPTTNPGHRGIDIAEIRFYQVRSYKDDERIFLEKLKTYNNMDHKGGEHRAWKPIINRVARLARRIMGLGVVPITESHPIPTPGHVLILARTMDRTKENGKEAR
jgi:hypothetical protein